jgi:hypothetical protein
MESTGEGGKGRRKKEGGREGKGGKELFTIIFVDHVLI